MWGEKIAADSSTGLGPKMIIWLGGLRQRRNFTLKKNLGQGTRGGAPLQSGWAGRSLVNIHPVLLNKQGEIADITF